MPLLTPWSPSKTQAFETLQSLWVQRQAFDSDGGGSAGGLQWKSVKGQEYLIHWYMDPKTGKRVFKSKGPRNAETEAFHVQFMEQRGRHRLNAASLDEQFHIQTAVAKAMKIGRAPVVIGDIFRAVAQSLRPDSVMLMGSMSMLAYEIQARANVPSLALTIPEHTSDFDLLVRNDPSLDGFEELLRSVDGRFRRQGYGSHRFTNDIVTIDCFTSTDLSRIADDVYGDAPNHAEAFHEATYAPAMSAYIVDRSGAIAPAPVMPIEKFRLMKTLRWSGPLGADRDGLNI